MATNIFTDSLMQHIVTLLEGITFSPVLTILTDYDLRRLPDANAFSTLFDFVIVEPEGMVNSLSADVPINAYKQIYTFNIWYGRKGAQNVDLNSLKITESNKIFEKLSDNISFSSLSLRSGAIVRSAIITAIQYQNALQLQVVRLGMLAAIVLHTVQITMEVRRQTG